MPETIIIIPARYGSSRFPGKPLHRFAGHTLIEHTWRAAVRTRLPVFVATDSDEIRAHCDGFGAEVVMTGTANNGTERCAVAAQALGHAGIVVNWQGDSPLTPSGWIRPLVGALAESGCEVATPIMRAHPKTIEQLRHDAMIGVPGATTAVVDHRFRALYFSKAVLPPAGPVWLHLGVYAYRAGALASYGRDPGNLERSEGLEQLRFVERGDPVYCMPVESRELWEVNNPGDVAIVERLMGARDGAVRA